MTSAHAPEPSVSDAKSCLIALFAAGSHTAVGDGSVGKIFDLGKTTLTGNVTMLANSQLTVNDTAGMTRELRLFGSYAAERTQ